MSAHWACVAAGVVVGWAAMLACLASIWWLWVRRFRPR